MGLGQQEKTPGSSTAFNFDEPEASEQDAIFGEDYIGDYSDDPDDEDARNEFGLNDPSDERTWTDDYRDYIERTATGWKGLGGSLGTREEQLRAREYSQEMARRRKYGLENEKMYEYANRLAEIAEGKRKTAGEIAAEKELALLASGQRGLGRTRGRGSFDVAEALRLGGLAAQGVESEGGALIASAAKQAQGAADAQLEQLLIAGQERAADRALNMEMLKMQQEQASGALWTNVLTGVLGAVGTVVGAVIPGGSAATAAIGGAIGSSAGSAGRYLG